jgi:hypothetical protein
MDHKPKGALLVWMNVEPAGREDFDAWYTREHIPERVGVPGFFNGSRYEAVNGDPRFLAVYDTESAEVLSSAAYLERLNNPTPWTQRVMPMFRDTVRSAGRLIGDRGEGIGGFLRTFRVEPQPGRQEHLRQALSAPILERLAECDGVVRVRCAEAVDTGHGKDTAETAMRGKDETATFVVLVDGTDAALLEAACGEEVSEQRLASLGAETPVHIGDYRLMYSLVK